MATCIFCGAQIPDDAKFCTACGAALPVEAEAVQQPIEVPVEVIPEQPAAEPYQQPAYAQPQPEAQPYQQAAQQSFEQPQQAYQQPYQQQPYQQPQQQQYQQPQQPQPTFAAPEQQAVVDSGSIGWGILGFIIPIVGIVLFFVWRNTKPKSGQVALIGAIISIVLGIFFQLFAGN